MKDRIRILIVDDDYRIASTLADILGWEGYKVETTNSAAEALIMARQNPFCCVISDIRMPDIDGIAFAQQLHQIQPRLPVILMSAYIAEEFIQNIAEIGVLAVLDKPLPLNYLLDFLAKLQQESIVVLVGDDITSGLDLGNQLQSYGFSFKQIVDPAQVMAEISGPEMLLMLDVKPATNFQILQQINDRYNHLPILLITDNADEMKAEIGQAFHANKIYGCLTKPVDINELLRRLDSIRTQQLQKALGKQ